VSAINKTSVFNFLFALYATTTTHKCIAIGAYNDSGDSLAERVYKRAGEKFNPSPINALFSISD
jgi:hypothetical protein